jgi:hypothetical protein
MSDRLTNTEVEDVLASIRRLVADDKRPPAMAEKKPIADRLVLTPSLRVTEAPQEEPDTDTPDWSDDRQILNAIQGAVEDTAAASEQDDTSFDSDDAPFDFNDEAEDEFGEVEAMDEGDNHETIPDSWDEITDELPGGAGIDEFIIKRHIAPNANANANADADADTDAGANDAGQEHADRLADDEWPSDTEHRTVDAVLEDVEQQVEDHDDQDDAEAPDLQLTGIAVDAEDDEADDKVANEEEANAEIDDDVPVAEQSLSQKIAALEMLIGGQDEEFEPDSPGANDYAGTHARPMDWEDAEEEPAKTAPSVEKEPPVDMVPPTKTVPPVETAPPVEMAAIPVAETSAPQVYTNEEDVLDEEALRELVSDIVREELQGALGERITRNVRKLVRREIHRALTAQELE